MAENQKYYESDLNRNLFSGTPYGAVDIIPYGSDYGKYKTLAFLGWNTYEESLAEKLKKYVSDGGSLFISLCHFNMTDRNDREMTFPDAETLEPLLGVIPQGTFIPEGEIKFKDGFAATADAPITTAACSVTTAAPIAYDSNGNAIIYKNSLGKGVVYFGAFKDYFSADWSIDIAKHIMEIMASETATVICDNPNIAFTNRKTADRNILQLLNMSCADTCGQDFTVAYKKDGKCREIKGELNPCEIVTLDLDD